MVLVWYVGVLRKYSRVDWCWCVMPGSMKNYLVDGVQGLNTVHPDAGLLRAQVLGVVGGVQTSWHSDSYVDEVTARLNVLFQTVDPDGREPEVVELKRDVRGLVFECAVVGI